MALYDAGGIGSLSASLTQDPLKPIEHGVAVSGNTSGPGQAGLMNGSNPVTAVTSGDFLRVVRGGTGYTDGTGLATTTTTDALNVWSGQHVHNPALTTVTVDITTRDGVIVLAEVNAGAADTVGYRTGDWIQVTQTGASGGVLEICMDDA